MPKIIVNPGHDAKFAGATGEYEFAKRIVEALRNYVDFLYVPDDIGGSNANDNLIRTVNWVNANSDGNDTYIAIHCNAGGGNGTEVWYYGGNDTSKSEGEFFARTLSETADEPNRGAKPDTSNKWGRLAEVRDTEPWAWLCECGFVDSSDGNDLADYKVDLYARAIAKFLQHRGFPVRNLDAPTSTPVDPRDARISELQNTVSQKDGEINVLKGTITNNDSRIAELLNNIASIKNEKSALVEQINTLTNQNTSLSSELEAEKTVNSILENEKKALNEAISACEASKLNDNQKEDIQLGTTLENATMGEIISEFFKKLQKIITKGK